MTNGELRGMIEDCFGDVDFDFVSGESEREQALLLLQRLIDEEVTWDILEHTTREYLRERGIPESGINENIDHMRDLKEWLG